MMLTCAQNQALRILQVAGKFLTDARGNSSSSLGACMQNSQEDVRESL